MLQLASYLFFTTVLYEGRTNVILIWLMRKLRQGEVCSFLRIAECGGSRAESRFLSTVMVPSIGLHGHSAGLPWFIGITRGAPNDGALWGKMRNMWSSNSGKSHQISFRKLHRLPEHSLGLSCLRYEGCQGEPKHRKRCPYRPWPWCPHLLSIWSLVLEGCWLSRQPAVLCEMFFSWIHN